MSAELHHPEARFRTPADLIAHYKGVYDRVGRAGEAQKARERQAAALALAQVPPPPEKPTRDFLHLHTPPSADVFAPCTPRPIRNVIAEIASDHKVSVADILSPRRDAKSVNARRAAIGAVAEARPLWSLPQLGRVFNRDHSTIFYTLRKLGLRP